MAMAAWERRDVRSFPFAGGRLDVYRRDDKLVVGPCMSLYLDEAEVVRIDLPFEPEGAAHEHWWGLPGKPRLYYPRHWPHLRLVELACSNLVEHTPTAAKLAGKKPPPRSVLVEAAEWALGELVP